MTQTPYDANSVLMGGGAGNPAWKFDEPNPGQPRTGTITEPPQTRQERDYDKNNPGGGDLKFFPSGDPIMGVIVTVQTDERDPVNITDDDGKRTFYIEGRYLKEAVRNAVKATGARGLEVGAQIHVEFTHREDPMDKRSRKFWKITYTPAASTALMSDQPQQGVGGQPAAPAPPPVSAPAQAPVSTPTPVAPQQVPAPVQAPVPQQAPAQAPATAPAEAPAITMARSLIQVGQPDESIAAHTGLDINAVAALRASTTAA
ncbi:hypothetical protein [Ruania rhizosphaerae]|uniref:hypothetical protein n=1 Tax=Ruania rhizosphaerae TaxID=1840413 RepID=UPI00135B832F|nr:hypothetical protein [Ruania rhizosphaerae]